MYKTIAWLLAAIVIIGGGWYVYSRNNPSAPAEQSQAQGDAPAVSAAIVGTWRSTDDAKFVRTFKADGTITDTYEGETAATVHGTYAVVDPLKEPAGAFGAASSEYLTSMTVLKVTFPQSEVLYFGVNSLTDTSLKLISLSGRGNILSFTKVQ